MGNPDTSLWHPFSDMAAVRENEFVVSRGEGVWLWDEDGNRYLDGSASLWYCNIGHGRPEIAEAVRRQIDELERVGHERVAAFFMEPVIGAGGVLPPPEGYVQAVAEICRDARVLFVCDSVICGFGRLGTWFGFERFGVEPDLVTFAKGVTSGYLPLGGGIGSHRVAEPVRSGPGGRPLPPRQTD